MIVKTDWTCPLCNVNKMAYFSNKKIGYMWMQSMLEEWKINKIKKKFSRNQWKIRGYRKGFLLWIINEQKNVDFTIFKKSE